MIFKNLQKKYDTHTLGVEAFFEAIEVLVRKIYKDEVDEEGNFDFSTHLETFLEITEEFFENLVQQ